MTRARVTALLGLVAVAVGVAVLLGRGDDGYTVEVQLRNAGGLREGFKVRVDGVPVGKVTKVELGRGDVASAHAQIEDSAAPLGSDARATVRAINILGEKYLDIERGDASKPAPSGVVIPAARTGGAVELDDVIDTLDLPTRAALNVVLDEAGRGLAGRGGDLAATVAALPPALDRTGELLRALGDDNRALGRLVDESDRVVAAVAAERRALGRTVHAGAATLEALGDRRRPLGETVRNAPSTLAALRQALGALESAAVPLRPAARGLRATAPSLTTTLRRLPSTADAARPALSAAREVAPDLNRLATVGTPVVHNLRPMVRQLAKFSADAEPATKTIDDGFADILGVMEAWARATAPRDASGHIFRLAVGGGADLLEALASGPPATAPRRAADAAPKRPAPATAAPPGASKPVRQPQVQVPPLRLPKLPDLGAKPELRLPGVVGREVDELLDYLLGP